MPSTVAPGTRLAPVIASLANVDTARWDAFVRAHPQGTPLHLTAWKRALERVFGYQQEYLVAQRNGEISGVLPLCFVKNPIVGRVLLSAPFAVYGGILAADVESELALARAAARMAHERNVDFLELREQHDAAYDDYQKKEGLYVKFETELPGNPEVLMKSCPRDTRYMVRKGQKAGLEGREGIDQLDTFFPIYAYSVRQLGTPVFSKRWFQVLAGEYGDDLECLVIRHQGLAVAAVLSLRMGDTIYPYYGGSIAAGRKTAANNFMYWDLMCRAMQRGVRRFDFGRSKKNTGAYTFKSTWNMQERSLPYQYCLVRRREMPNFSPANPKFSLAIRAWQKLPLSLTTAIGPSLIRLFP